MPLKVLYAVARVHEAAEPALARLRAADCELVFNRTGRTLTEDELIGLLPGVFGTIAGGEPYTERVFAAAPQLKVVARMGVGYDKVDVAAATRHGAAICMGFGTNHEAVADHAFALMAGLANRLLPYHQEVTEGRWGGHFQPRLFRTTVGIIGLSRIGRALARRCSGISESTAACCCARAVGIRGGTILTATGARRYRATAKSTTSSLARWAAISACRSSRARNAISSQDAVEGLPMPGP
jgi:phosphoglycerate dehydrogenase-like enzyme